MGQHTQNDPKNEAEITYWNSAGGCRWLERQQSQDIVLSAQTDLPKAARSPNPIPKNDYFGSRWPWAMMCLMSTCE